MYLTYPVLSLEIPPEPEKLTKDDSFIKYTFDSNGLINFHYVYIGPDSKDPVLVTKRRVKTWGTIRAKDDLEKLEKQWRSMGYHFLWHYNAGGDVYTFYAIFLYPIFYEFDGILWIDREENGITGDEQIYEIFGQHDKI